MCSKHIACNDVQISLIVLANKIDGRTLKGITTCWSTIDIGRISGILWFYRSWKRIQILLINLVDVVRGHCMLERIGYPANDLCRGCLNEE